MPDQTNGSKPPRMHGITHVDIPAQYRPAEDADAQRTPDFDFNRRRLHAHQGSRLLCSLPSFPGAIRIPGVASFLVANPSLAFSMLPRMFRPISGYVRSESQSTLCSGASDLFSCLSPFSAGCWPSSCGRCQTSGAGQPFSGHRIRWSARYVFLCSIRSSGVQWLSTSLPCRMNTSWLFLSALPGIC